jgi:hypothetical protein
MRRSISRSRSRAAGERGPPRRPRPRAPPRRVARGLRRRQNSNCDDPVEITRLGEPCKWRWDETRDLIREGLLLFMVENQAVSVWAVRLDAGDDPPVVVARDPDLKWRACAERFSTFIESQVWDHTEIFVRRADGYSCRRRTFPSKASTSRSCGDASTRGRRPTVARGASVPLRGRRHAFAHLGRRGPGGLVSHGDVGRGALAGHAGDLGVWGLTLLAVEQRGAREPGASGAAGGWWNRRGDYGEAVPVRRVPGARRRRKVGCIVAT